MYEYVRLQLKSLYAVDIELIDGSIVSGVYVFMVWHCIITETVICLEYLHWWTSTARVEISFNNVCACCLQHAMVHNIICISIVNSV